MTRDEVKTNLQTRDLEWLEERWTVLKEAVEKIGVVIDEVESSFEYPFKNPDESPLEYQVAGEMNRIWNIVVNDARPDLDRGKVSWKSLVELIDDEIEIQETALRCPNCKGRGYHYSKNKDGSICLDMEKVETCSTCKGTGANIEEVERQATKSLINQGETKK